MSWLIFALLSMVSFVTYDVIGRYLATKSEDPRAFAAIINLVIALMGPTIFLVDRTMPSAMTPTTIGLTIIGLTLWALMGRFEYFAKKHVEASVFSITVKIAPVITFVLGVIFLKESFTLSKLAAIILIIFANTLLYLGSKRGSVISSQGIKYMTILIVVLSVAWLFDAINVKNWGVGTFTTLSYLAPFVLSAFFPPLKWAVIKKELTLTPWWQFLVLGFFSLVGYGSLLKAYTLGEASSVTPVATSTTPLVVLAGVILLGERDFLGRKLLASILTFLAIYLMR